MGRSIGAKMRFEVFKRDGFCCLYCGSHPPDALLHVDHIVPVAGGGGNDMDNLATACDRCNFGKGARLLSATPKSLDAKAAEVAEREAQIRGYAAVMKARRERIEDDCWEVFDVLRPQPATVTQQEFQSVRNFVGKLGLHDVLEAADIAVGKVLDLGDPWRRRNRFRYFCGVCWAKIREREADADDLRAAPTRKGAAHE